MMADVNTKNAAWLKSATGLARSFLMMFNGALLYGCAHPNTAKNAEAFQSQLAANFPSLDMLNIIVNNGTLMIEDWPLDMSFNTRRIVQHFEKIGLASVSFERGVTAESVIKLIGLAGDVGNVDACRASVERARSAGSDIPFIRLNYVLYGKIKADEIVVKEGAVAPLPPNTSNISTGQLSSVAAAQIEEALTLSSLLEKPGEVSEALAQATAEGRSEGRIVSAFGGLRNEINKSAKTHSADELLESLFTLKQDLREAIQVQKATGKVMDSASAIDREINDLTCAAIVKLAKDEYKSGKTPINRLAHAIRRMLPSNTELIRVLPNLKNMLLSEGMSLGDYLELVRALGLSLESETLSDALKEAADSVGATTDDLAAAIRERPEEAARLILLASEVRGVGGDASRLSDMLTEYIEEVSAKITADTGGGEAERDGAALKKILSQMGSRMLEQLTAQGVPEPIMAAVRERLSERSGDARPEVSAARRPAIKLPPEALSAGNLLFLINKELGRHARYKTPFNTVLISVNKIIAADCARAPLPADATELLPQIFAGVVSLLRDVDMIGTLDSGAIPELLIMLPMTTAEGAEIVRERIVQKIERTAFTLSGQKIQAAATVSITCPDDATKNIKAFMTKARADHAALSATSSTFTDTIVDMPDSSCVTP